MPEADALLEILERGLLRIRGLASVGDRAQIGAVADTLHNAPRLLREGQRRGWTVGEFQRLFLEAFIERYPELRGVQQPLDEIRLARSRSAREGS